MSLDVSLVNKLADNFIEVSRVNKLADNFNLYDSEYCRLCSDKNKSGVNLFSEKFDDKLLFTLVNEYLPISIRDDGRYPQTICPGCHIQLQATISFFDLIIAGQQKLREILNRNVHKVLVPYKKTEITVEPPLYGLEHKLHQKAAGLDEAKLKRGRGRPRKSLKPKEDDDIQFKDIKTCEESEDCIARRTRKGPIKFKETVKGQELEDVCAEEDLIDPEEKEGSNAGCEKDSEVIGHIHDLTGKGLGEVVAKSTLITPGTKGRIALQFKCDICSSIFSHESKLHKHQTEKHKVTNYPTINIVNHSLTEANRVELKKEKKFSCNICHKKFRFRSSLKGHLLSRHSLGCNNEEPTSPEKKRHQCKLCDKKFLHLSSLSYHKEVVHSNGIRYSCNKCDKTFKHRQLLKRHQLVHSDVRDYFCKLCGCSFKTKANLLNHATTHTKEKQYFCHICEQQFAYRASLSIHLRSHTNLKPFECAVCKKTFTQKGNLKEHIRTHTGERPFQCQVCPKTFITSSQFRLHSKRHMGVKPWKCEYCGKAFLHKNTWSCHLRRHRGEKPFQCKHCDKKFSERWALRKHIRSHTGEKPYTCTVCDKKFADCSNLNKHKNTHTNAAKLKKTDETEIKKAPTGEKLEESVGMSNDKEVRTLVKHDVANERSRDKKVWSYVSPVSVDISSDDSNDVESEDKDEKQLFYVTYEDPDDPNNRVTQKVIITKDELERLSKGESHLIDDDDNDDDEESTADVEDALNGIFVSTMQVMDEHGNPFKFDAGGTLFQVTTMEGEPIQMGLGDDDSFPITITTNGQPASHHPGKPVNNLPTVQAMQQNVNVPSRTNITEFQHFKLISDLSDEPLNLSSGYF